MNMAQKKKAGKRPASATPAGAADGEKAKRRPTIRIWTDYLYFPDRATVGQVLQACQGQHSQGSTLLVTKVEGAYRICSLGSLLPYLTGQTPHIVHRLGDCPICSGLDPLVWQNVAALLTEALADVNICSRLLSHLPLAQIPVIEATRLAEEGIVSKLAGLGFTACAVTDNGTLCGVYIMQQMRSLGGLPAF
jgi:hypothetical protein